LSQSKNKSNIEVIKKDNWPADLRPNPDQLASVTDTYFLRTRDIVSSFGDTEVTYAIFMRRPVISALNPAMDWLKAIVKDRNGSVNIKRCFKEGEDVGAGEPMVYISGSMLVLVDLETALLQKIGATCVAAYNAKSMVESLTKTSFLAMDARHCAGTDMADLMAYGAFVGSQRVKSEQDAIGFIGCATDRTAHLFENTSGLGTMPHALIGYAGSTLKAAKMFHSTWPDQPLTVLIDYFGKEIIKPKSFKNVSFSLGVSFVESSSMEMLMKENILACKERFINKEFEVVFHHSLDRDKFKLDYKSSPSHVIKHNKFADWLESEGIGYVDISGSAENLINYYSNVDLHIGFRVHAHIFMNSIARQSILVSEDGRAKGVKGAIGGIVLDGYLDFKDSIFAKVFSLIFLLTIER
jgi:hypothetical protein